MDAKPQRPARTIRVRNDENMPPTLPINKTIHQRNKSSPALSTMLEAGGLKAAAKRTAFGDVSNIVNVTRPSKDDSAISTKQGLQAVTKPNLQERKSTTFLRPAQRPLSVSGLKGILTGSSNAAPVEAIAKVGVAELPGPTQTANTRKILTKRNTTIFRDGILDTVQETEAVVDVPAQSTKLDGAKHDAVTTVTGFCPRPEPQISLPPPVSEAVTAGDPVKDQVNQASDSSLPGISEVTLDAPVLSSEANDQDLVKRDQSRDDRAHITKLQTFHTAVEAIPYDLNLQILHPTLPPLRKAEPYQQPALKPTVPAQSIPALLPHFSQPHAPSELEETWDEDDEEPYDEEGYVTARSYRSRGENTTGGASTVLFPQMNQKTRREIAAAKDLVEATRTTEEIEDESYDTSMVAEYGEEIFDYMKQLEVKMLPNAHYMDNQHEIQWSMRSVLMDWLVQVHHRFNLLPETLFLTVNYIDRFLSCKVVSLGKLQLVGATAIFIAAKYEEINCPSVQEIVYMVDGGYTVDEILKAERFMLTMLQFELGWPGPMSFLRRISKADDYDLETRTLAKYFLEVTVMDERFIGSPPSFMAAASHCLARMMLHKGSWTPHHVYYSNYTFSQLRPLLSLLLECCDDPRKHHAAVYNKYCDKRYKRASAFVESEIGRGFQLPGTPVIKEALQPQLFHYYDNQYLRM